MIALTLEEIARVVDGTVHGTAGPGLTVTGPVVIDSRDPQVLNNNKVYAFGLR